VIHTIKMTICRICQNSSGNTEYLFNQKNSSQLCCGVKNEEGVSLEGETTCPLPIQNGFLNPFDTSQLCCGELH